MKVTNGWRQTTPFIHKLWSAQKIEWFSVKNQKWIDAFWKKSGHFPAESSNASSPSITITSPLISSDSELKQISIVPFSIPTTDLKVDKEWDKFASFTIEYQARKGGGYSEQQATLENSSALPG